MNNIPEISRIRKGKYIKSLRENGVLIAQLYEHKGVQYVITNSENVFTSDEDNSQEIAAALFPYEFNSKSLFRAMKKSQKDGKVTK